MAKPESRCTKQRKIDLPQLAGRRITCFLPLRAGAQQFGHGDDIHGGDHRFQQRTPNRAAEDVVGQPKKGGHQQNQTHADAAHQQKGDSR